MKTPKAILLFIIILIVGCAHEIMPVILKKAPKPNKKVLSFVAKAISEYRDSLQWKDQCVINIDSDYGIIETNWNPVHKGEIKRKIQIYVWGKIYRVDVWHRGPFTSSYGLKDYMARLVELDLQSSIEKNFRS